MSLQLVPVDFATAAAFVVVAVVAAAVIPKEGELVVGQPELALDRYLYRCCCCWPQRLQRDADEDQYSRQDTRLFQSW